MFINLRHSDSTGKFSLILNLEKVKYIEVGFDNDAVIFFIDGTQKSYQLQEHDTLAKHLDRHGILLREELIDKS